MAKMTKKQMLAMLTEGEIEAMQALADESYRPTLSFVGIIDEDDAYHALKDNGIPVNYIYNLCEKGCIVNHHTDFVYEIPEKWFDIFSSYKHWA